MDVKFDSDNNVILTDEQTNLKPPRPVFYEEMDLLGFDEYYTYPRTCFPILWCVGRKYYYKGMHICTARGGDALNLPRLNVIKKGLELEPVDLNDLLIKNIDQMKKLRYNTMAFIKSEIEKYQDNARISVGFSGGKDSQVLLDLVLEVYPDTTIIFSDTTLEHDFTYENIEKTKKFYGVDLEIAKPPYDAMYYFSRMGLPSRFQRWCTPILKTAPYHQLIRNLVNEDKIVVFEGVRREESKKREKYESVAEGVVLSNVVNIRPILDWNVTEIFLYILFSELPLNKLYKYGLTRVGCEICPFQSKWSETIINHIDSNFEDKYRFWIDKYGLIRGLETRDELDECIVEGYWKKRCGGKGMDDIPTCNFKQDKNCLKAIITDFSSSFDEWSKVLPEKFYSEVELKESNDCEILIKDIDVKTRTKLKKIIKKTAYCIGCGVCDVECSNNAINTHPLYVDAGKCIHCGDCYSFNYHGCLRAKSLS